MDKFDIKANKYWFAMIFLCLTFLFLVLNAYRFIQPPEKLKFPSAEMNENTAVSKLEDYQKTMEKRMSEKNAQQENTEKINQKSGTINFEKGLDTPPELETISPPPSNIAITDNPINTDYAEKLANDGKYESAVYEYQKLAKYTGNTEEKAKCYEKIAAIYCGLKRYHSASSYAQEAYNISPTDARRAMLYDIYTKTGNVDKANLYKQQNSEQKNYD